MGQKAYDSLTRSMYLPKQKKLAVKIYRRKNIKQNYTFRPSKYILRSSHGNTETRIFGARAPEKVCMVLCFVFWIMGMTRNTFGTQST